ncbi:MAG: hypothetical protein AAGG51_29995 [Cyanobacteria bacterium P01_G01_bin.54]
MNNVTPVQIVYPPPEQTTRRTAAESLIELLELANGQGFLMTEGFTCTWTPEMKPGDTCPNNDAHGTLVFVYRGSLSQINVLGSFLNHFVDDELDFVC